ncbi:transporter substrate-binding domain-containing protein [Aliiglaciecola sp. 3_MG-2023]|uniref:substrate-binding periplasmic protein n=1 Tax=Aliiglaciecola sp. 3_MG-2023 TaxID=3062644 RepID=UPI0026E36698|nr:transporter substrate-binding domain-containing protein [Aliiglaciecola sp. 3_MG-2023]MDO6692116.1 transporter substrate-binding domain-containing protein [Aliiglaciecola sp. 3_MG-2023]
MLDYLIKVIFVGCLVFSSSSYANQEVKRVEQPIKLVFAINDPGAPPYLYFDEKRHRYQGIVPDFFASFPEDEKFKVVFLDSNRSRNEHLVLAGKADIFLSSPAWLNEPEEVLFSNELLLHKSFLYSLTQFNQPFSLSTISQKLICARRGYVYPSLTQSFTDGKLIRVDSSAQITIVNMLLKGRCDYAVMNEYNANSVINQTQFCGQTFYKSPSSVHDTSLVFVINKDLEHILPALNRQWRTFRESGQLSNSIRLNGGIYDSASANRCK